MVKRLRYKFIAITMLCVFIVLIIVVSALNAINMYCIDSITTDILFKIANNNGVYPKVEDSKESHSNTLGFETNHRFDSSYFIVRTDKDGNIYQHDIEHISYVTAEAAEEYVKEVINLAPMGRIENYKYACKADENGRIFVFLDCGFQYQIFNAYMFFSGYISFFALIFIFIFVFFISGKVISPIAEAVEKQKTFITNASHELKTPIAIIMANTDVLEMMYEKSEWIDSIRNQSLRLNELVKSMLTLAKFENEVKKTVFADFNASSATLSAAEPFRTSLQNKNNEFVLSVSENVTLKGDEAAYKQLISILMDNAVKYTKDGGKVSVMLSATEKQLKLQISNTCENVPKTEELNKLFGRFYRTDSSRSRNTGGFGIGLSIAKSIADSHKGKIFAEIKDENIICFNVMIPRKK